MCYIVYVYRYIYYIYDYSEFQNDLRNDLWERFQNNSGESCGLLVALHRHELTTTCRRVPSTQGCCHLGVITQVPLPEYHNRNMLLLII